MCVSVRVCMLSIECLAGQCSRNGAVFCVRGGGLAFTMIVGTKCPHNGKT